MNPEINIKKYEIMSRVRTVRGMRLATTSPLVSGAFGIILALGLSLIVSMGDVLSNTMAHVNWSERFSYVFQSLLHSRVIVQTMTGLIAAASAVVFVNSIRSVRRFNIGRFMFGSTQQV